MLQELLGLKFADGSNPLILLHATLSVTLALELVVAGTQEHITMICIPNISNPWIKK